ncbi:MAG: Type II/IV secretion system secretin RcpA/CpaC, associated with Flp pilus assembly, partial [uncultured Microvirga sp.]
RAFVDVVVGDPETADVMPLTDTTLYVLGQKIGTTNIAVYDAAKALVGVIEVEVGYNTPRLAADVARDGGGAGARVGSSNGRTVLSGSVEDGPDATRAVTLARQYGPDPVNDLKVRSPQQVMLEVRFVEASRSAGKAFGVKLQGARTDYNPDTGSVRQVAGASGLTSLTGLAGNVTPFGSMLVGVLAKGVQADVLISALEDRGLVRRLAEPNLVALSGEKASFLAGGEFPIPVAGDRDRITVDYKKFGVSLNFTPTVLSKGVINLKIEPEVSQIDPTTVVRTASVTVPGFIVRRASTTVELRDGQSFAIAGLLQSVNQETKEQLPWIGDIPIIGALFRSAAFEKKETELAIIVTPRLVKPTKPGERLRTPLDNAMPVNDIDRFLVGEQEIPVAEAEIRGKTRPPSRGHILDLRQDGSHVTAAN